MTNFSNKPGPVIKEMIITPIATIDPPLLNAAGLHARRFARRFERNVDGDLFIFGDFVEIHMQHFAAHRVVLDFLHEREALGLGIALHGQVDQEVFGNRVVDEVADLLGIHLEVLRLGLATINRRRHTAGRTEFFDFTALNESARKRF